MSKFEKMKAAAAASAKQLGEKAQIAAQNAQAAAQKAKEASTKVKVGGHDDGSGPREWTGFSAADKMKQEISRRTRTTSISDDKGFNVQLFEQSKQLMKEKRSRLQDIANETALMYKKHVSAGTEGKRWSELMVDFGRAQGGNMGRGIEELAVVNKTIENTAQTSSMEALESVTQGINRLLDFEYKKVHELKMQLYDVDKKRRDKRKEVDDIQKRKDAGKEIDEQKAKEKRSELDVLEFQHEQMGNQLFFQMQVLCRTQHKPSQRSGCQCTRCRNAVHQHMR